MVIRMEPSLRYPTKRSTFFTSQGERPIGAGIVLWRGYFQSVRPAIGRLLINVDTATGTMYRSGRLMDLVLEFLGQSTPNALTPQRGAQRGLPERERLRLQHFLSGIKVTTPYRARDPDRRRFVKKVTRESARERTFEIGEGEVMTVAEYFQNQLNMPLQYPDAICVEVRTTSILSVGISPRHDPQFSTGAVVPLEFCQVPPGQLARKNMSQDQTNSILQFATMDPRARRQSVQHGLGVCPV
jgi:eukaryotic translation initiation factor 2C